MKKKIAESGILYGISWEMYENLLEKYQSQNTPRFTYDSGVLEIETVNSLNHEEDKRNLEALFEHIALELELDFRRSGSTTFKRQSLRKGFEPDSCFYLQSLKLTEGKRDLDFENDPPPDLIIEINRTSSSIPRMPIFAAFGVRELWRFENEQVKFYALDKGVYIEIENSIALPLLTSEKATEFLESCRELSSTNWVRIVRERVAKEKQSYLIRN